MKAVFLFIFIIRFSFLQAQTDLGENNEYHEEVNIYTGDVYNENHYHGLNKKEKELVYRNNKKIKEYEQIIRQMSNVVASSIAQRDSLAKAHAELKAFYRQREQLILMNDSIVSTLDKDSVVYKKLVARYELKLKAELASFWEAHPDIQPDNYQSMVYFIEENYNRYFSNLWNFSSPNGPKLWSCNECIRKYPRDWIGIKDGGRNYYFSGRGVNAVGAPPSYNFAQLKINIPRMGSKTIAQLQQHYRTYWDLKTKQEATIGEQYHRFLMNQRVDLY